MTKPKGTKSKPMPTEPKEFSIHMRIEHLRSFLGLIGALVFEAKFNVGPDGISVLIVNPSHTQMLKARVPPQMLGYDDELGSAVFALDTEELLGQLRSVPSGKNVNISGDGKKRLVLSYGETSYPIHALDPEGVMDPKLPPFEHSTAMVVADRMTVLRAMKTDVSQFWLRLVQGKTPMFLVEHEQWVSGPKPGQKETITIGHPVPLLKSKGEGKSSYDAHDLRHTIQAIHAGVVEISWGNEYPLEILADADFGEVRLLMAPIVADDKPESSPNEKDAEKAIAP